MPVARRAWLQCNGNSTANCADNRIDSRRRRPRPWCRIAPCSTATSCATARGGASRVTSRTRTTAAVITLNGGVRYDWQHSKYDGGCVPENVIRPDLLPAQCEEATQSGINPNTGQLEKIRPFGNFSPRVSVTYDLVRQRQDGAEGRRLVYYYKTRETLADNLGGLVHGHQADVRVQRQQRHLHRHLVLDRRQHGRRRPGERADRRADIEQRALQHHDRRLRAGRQRRRSGREDRPHA